jgi:outer membrane protein assembly factor BamB
MSIRRFTLFCLTPLFLAVAGPLPAGEGRLPWPARGGPNRDGQALPEDARGVPLSWNEESGEHIVWKIPLEGEGHSSPIIGQGRIWLTAATPDGTKQYVYCIDEQSGEVIHHKLLFENAEPEPLGNKINTYASPSCVLEEDAVYVHFGTYGTALLDPETAEIIWQRRDIECRHFRGPGSSPEIIENLVILTFDGIDQQFLMALDKRTGETVWRTDRSTDYGDLDEDGNPRADGDYRKAYSTPLVTVADGRAQVISTGAKAAFSYDALTGEELWTITHDEYNAAARPLEFNGHVIINTGSRRANLVSVRLDGTTLGDVDETHIVWRRERGNSDLSNPVRVGERIYMVTDNGVATCVDAASGEEIWTGRVGGTFVASPVVAGERVYVFNEEGETAVLKHADQFEVLSRNVLEEGMRSTPGVANGALFLRTFGHLYKIGARSASTE